LKNYLFERYGGFRNDRRVKDRTRDLPIFIDDRGSSDAPQLFCHISATFPDARANSFVLHLYNAPYSEQIQEMIRDRKGTFALIDDGLRASITVPLAPNRADIAFLRELGQAFQDIVSQPRTKRYADPNWRWVCPRVKGSLDQFADNLFRFPQRSSTNGNR
jgi:hypothetical protein